MMQGQKAVQPAGAGLPANTGEAGAMHRRVFSTAKAAPAGAVEAPASPDKGVNADSPEPTSPNNQRQSSPTHH
ncbi:hypothetical protein DZA28_14970 [Pseudomonas alloputida]|uniref:Uncharacterized protein n=2 Tax=Pseudomonas TaxID=286 RepID=A0ABD6N6C0_9PSED|nr:hypothetical protein [Pseudomonas hunanensis]PTV63045.1 hypothetical protein DBL03_08070 [Pseudomonas putida]TRZ61174.1 hypothetical protein DZA28_14970 [Pseudomonas alloputida]